MQPAPAADRCASCGEPLAGPYCSQCGEAVLDPAARTVRHFVAHAVLDEIVHLDGKFWRTLRALFFSPGKLTAEFIAGRRRPYIGPTKLLLAAIFLFVLLTQGGFVASLMVGPITLNIAPTAPPEGATIRESVFFIDRFGVLDRRLTRRIGPGDGPTGAAQAEFHERLRRLVQPLSFGNVFFLALGLFVMFRSRVPLLVDHLVFSVHAVTFVLLSSLLLLPANWFDESAKWITLPMVLAAGVWQFAYLTTAIRRCYFPNMQDRPPKGGRYKTKSVVRAFGVAVLLYLLNGIFVTAVQMIGGSLAIRAL